jgi:hypothetical protein
MTKQTIINAIEKIISKSYSSWTVGISNDPDRRKQEHINDGDDVTYWREWLSDSLSDAQEIEKYFIDKGCKGGTGGNLSAYKNTYVYIY